MSLANRLREARTDKGIRQEDLAKKLGKSKSVISNWERGDNKPDADTIFQICDILEINPNWLMEWDKQTDFQFTKSEQDLIQKLRQLSDFNRETISILITRLSESASQSLKVAEEEVPYAVAPTPSYTILRLYGIGPAAGSGNYLPDDIPQGEIQVLESWASKKADYALRVDGHSMEPRYQDGDIVLVKSQDAIRDGEVGIFAVNGEVVIKQLEGDHLHSLNPDYHDIHLSAGDMVKCLGKVIGKV